ncbi:hypothetical protein BH11MYX3_BH11MYX3_44750 [soil metagenome]
MSDKKHDQNAAADKPFNEARRRLLRMAVYVPPVVLGAITLSQAGCQPEPCSCPPSGGASCPTGSPIPKSEPTKAPELDPET